MHISEIANTKLEEDWKSKIAAGVAAAGILGSAYHLSQPDKSLSAPERIEKIKDQQIKLSPEQLEDNLIKSAKNAGIRGKELAQLLAQAKHESWNFTKLVEKPSSSSYFNRYDISKSPKIAKLLGNLHIGDGEKFKGRGYIQLTGRDNYERAGKALNLPLVDNPELAADPKHAANIAIWYWNSRVKPSIKNFSDTKAVTRKINAKLLGLDKRKEYFIDYVKQMQLNNQSNLKEVFDESSAFEVHWDPHSTKSDSYATAYDRQGREINISFIGNNPFAYGDEPSNGDWDGVDIEFMRAGRHDITGKGDAERVFATVIKAVKQYISKHHPTYVLFSGSETSRHKFYQTLVKRYASSFGYEPIPISKLPLEIGNISAYSQSVFALKKKNIVKEDTSHTPASAMINELYSTYKQVFGKNHIMAWDNPEEFVFFNLKETSPNLVSIDWLQAYPLRSGLGTKALKEIQQSAKKHGVDLTLYPWDKGITKQSSLIKFYTKNKFVPKFKNSKDMFWKANNLNESEFNLYKLPLPEAFLRKYLNEGYKILGYGVYQIALLAPDNTVIKLHRAEIWNDDFTLSRQQTQYIKFIEYCMKQFSAGNNFVPQFFGYKVINYDNFGVPIPILEVKTERLFELNDKYLGFVLEYLSVIHDIEDYKDRIAWLERAGRHDEADKMEWLIIHLGKEGLEQLIDTIHDLDRMTRGLEATARLDLHGGNFMYSADGDIVINDPFA